MAAAGLSLLAALAALVLLPLGAMAQATTPLALFQMKMGGAHGDDAVRSMTVDSQGSTYLVVSE